MTDFKFEENIIQSAENDPAHDAGAIAEGTERGLEAPVFGMPSRFSAAYTDERLGSLLNKYSEDDLKRQSDRLVSLYDEPEEPDYSDIDFGDEESAAEEEIEAIPAVEEIEEAPAVEETETEAETTESEPAVEDPETEEQQIEGSAEIKPEEATEESVSADSAPSEPETEETAAEEEEAEEPKTETPAAEEPSETEPAAAETQTGEPKTETPAAERPDFILSEGEPVSWYRMIPMILSAAVVPLIVQLKIFTLPLGGYFWTSLTDDSPIYDYCSWYKMIAVLGIAVLCLIVLAIDILRKKAQLRMSYAFVPAALFAVLAIISYAVNGFKEFTLFGWPGRMEGTLTLVAYMIILCYTVVTIDTARSARIVSGAFCVSLAVFCVIGALQLAGYDPLATGAAAKVTGIFEGVTDAMPGLTGGTVRQTFGDPSFSAAFLCLGIPAAAMLYTSSDYRGKWSRWIKAPLVLILIWLCFVNAAGGKLAITALGLAAALIAGLIVFHRNLKYWTKPLLLMIVSLALVLTVTYRAWMPQLQRLLPSVFPEDQAEETVRPGLNSVTTGRDNVTFTLKGSNMVLDIKVETENGSVTKVTPMNGLGQLLTLSESGDPGVYLINEEPYHSVFRLCIIKHNDSLALRVSMPEKDWDFVSEDGEIRYVSGTGRTVSLYEPERSRLIKDPGYADCAAAVWDSALPMLKSGWIFGHGADSFCLYYPHMDYAAAYTAGLDVPPSAEGPRSSLINTAFGTGWLSAAALAAIYLVYIAKCVIIYWRRKLSHPLAYTGAGIFLGTVGFLAAALVSDTSVCSMPSFMTLLGTGIAINRILKGGK